MKVRRAILIISLSLLCLAVAPAAGNANFSGVWVMDKSKAEGIPANMDQKMRVTQEGDKLELETDLFAGDEVNTINDAYTINGKEVEFTARLGSGQEAKGKRLAKWNADGNGFEVREEAAFETPEGKINITMHRKWTLSADGKMLLIELNHTGPNGPISSKRSFNKK